ncbi:MAG: efflux RND transporter periplasmic adaptor subunit [Brevundimonas sp.]|jgi:Cu(I)/Ag(I) efflux system membrane fusion protein|uniref:Cation efflux system protein CusB n=2 Tax=Brevundimonas TaxID=41275 RepID=A0A2X1BLN9_BREVE|nr:MULTISPECIES: efflux RND transporter periplasmic adaptor subunit [Brevundimonas]MBB5740733.1 Cu(I)/Ag(I) efflux system membrane fusion protein [Brevundimonas aurantiaca]MRL67342.1 efflux RND transporter periplasmic adaptor subunit [Brevundimonas sp. SPF441]QFU32265.1 Cation efflux system protein CusB precursor [Brevundimonas sp. Bb-A]SPU53402.1 Cation efflux system protein CusB precursor [Brevundimonas vesicularis]
MNALRNKRLGVAMGALLLVGVGVGAGIVVAPRLDGAGGETAEGAGEREILYWYDPMVPNERYPGPGKSSMNMDTIPKYADEGGSSATPGVRIDPALAQNLGVRYATARRGDLEGDLSATAIIGYNERDIAVVQSRADGFVQRVYNRAPGDVVAAGAPLVDLLIPSWGGAQTEYLAVRRTGNTPLIQAARQRLVLLGMSEGVIASVERSGRARNTITISTPTGGVIKTLSVRAGMSVAQGMTLAEINGLSTVWVNAAIPEALANQLRAGQSVEVALAAFPGERFTGRLTALLPELVGDSRTITARIEMANRGGRLRPGMFGRITFGGGSTSALLVPTEAVIRTGERDIVMLALPEGRYQPAEVRIGREAGGQTEILAGLREGERIVASGQFLIDSEASLSGVTARPIGQTSGPARAPASPTAGRPAAAQTGASMAAPAPRERSGQ